MNKVRWVNTKIRYVYWQCPMLGSNGKTPYYTDMFESIFRCWSDNGKINHERRGD